MNLYKSAAFFSISRFSSSSCKSKSARLTPISYSTSSSADKFWDHLQRSQGNIERTLTTVQGKLDSSCVIEVMNRCSVNHSQLGLRFFIWAGIQSNYRHSSYMYLKACKLFQITQNPGVISEVFEAYVVDRCLVGVKTFQVVLKLCKEAKLAKEGLSLLRKMQEFNCRPNTTLYNLAIQLFCENRDMDVAERLMKEMSLFDLHPNMMTFIAMIKGFCSIGRLEDACKLLSAMNDHGCAPNVVVYTIILDGFLRFGSAEKGWEFLRAMEKEGSACSPNAISYAAVIRSFCENRQLADALGVLDHMEVHGCAPNWATSKILLNCLCAEGCEEEAYKLIDRLVAGGGVSNDECYSLLIASLLRIKRLEEAEKLFNTMLASSMKPDGFACNLLMKELCLNGRVLDGFNACFEFERVRNFYFLGSDTCSILLSGLCEGGHFVEAAKLAGLMLERGASLKSPYADKIVEHLKNTGGIDLIRQLTRAGIAYNCSRE